jgi:mannose-6-phosphate isomerase-like protein (cupin superfamily)
VVVGLGAGVTGAGPPLPGGVAVSHLRVYDSEAPDGRRGGTPHVHTACTEAYVVVAGRGTVQTLTTHGPAETPLEAGALVWFTPGTIHRLVNHGELEILVLMANAGLPEAGDMVITFPPEVLDDPEAYAAAAALPPGGTTTAGDDGAARRRRDLGVEGLERLLDDVERTGGDALAAFHRRAARLVAPRVETWRTVWSAGPLTAARATGAHLDALAHGDASHLAAASVHATPPPPAERRYGCCGTLGTYLPLER